MYEFLDTFAAHKVAPKVLSQTSDFTVAKVSIRIVFRGVYMAISVFLGCLLPFFGDFIALTGSLAAFTLQGGFIHHMIIKVCMLPNVTLFYHVETASCCEIPCCMYPAKLTSHTASLSVLILY